MRLSRTIYPKFSRARVDRAGEKIRTDQFVDEEINIIENWRASHAYILNTFQATLRNRTRRTDIVFAQRLKRRPTIYDKLKREPEMRLSRMHDIAGCRLIFHNEKDLVEFRQEFHKSRFKHRLRNEEDKFNYIKNPKESGYRGIHDVYIYDVNSESGKKWNGLSLEIQYRTTIQHAWATAVEIAGSITANQPKFGRGSDEYKDFFKLTSELLARHYENKNSCLKDITDKNLREKIQEIENKIGIMRTFEGLNLATNEFKRAKNAILVFSILEKKLEVIPYEDNNRAIARYFELEKQTDLFRDIVLVRADSNDKIKNAFRNYFSDSREFVDLIKKALVA